jgi:hypothetical protein
LERGGFVRFGGARDGSEGVGFEVVALFPDSYLVCVTEGADFAGEELVGFESGGLDVGVEGSAELGLHSGEFVLEGGVAFGEFPVESAAQFSRALGDFSVK